MLTSRDIGWIAGFIEGEGSFNFSATSRVLVGQVQREPLERLQGILGGTITRHIPKSPRRQPYHFWKVSASRAVGLMMTIYPLMSPRRREQIRGVLHRWRQGPGSGSVERAKTQCPRGHPYDEANTRRYVNARGYLARECRTCRKEIYQPRANAFSKEYYRAHRDEVIARVTARRNLARLVRRTAIAMLTA